MPGWFSTFMEVAAVATLAIFMILLGIAGYYELRGKRRSSRRSR